MFFHVNSGASRGPKVKFFPIFARTPWKMFEFSYMLAVLSTGDMNLFLPCSPRWRWPWTIVAPFDIFNISSLGASCAASMIEKFIEISGIRHSQPQNTWDGDFIATAWHIVRVGTGVSSSRNIVRVLRGTTNLENSLVDQECDISTTMQAENCSAHGHHTAQSLCAKQGLPNTKVWVSKNPRCQNCAFMNFSHAVTVRYIPHIPLSQAPAIDERPISTNVFLVEECTDDRPHWTTRTLRVGNSGPQSSPMRIYRGEWICMLTNINEAAVIQASDAGLVTSERSHIRSSKLVGWG